MKRLNRTLPMLGALALVGTAAGVSLGHSAIGEINPLYFGDATDRFHAELSPALLDRSAPLPGASGTAITQADLGDGCFGCGGARVEYYAAPAVVTYSDGWSADSQRAAAPIEAAPQAEAAPDPERERLIRYASYRIVADEPEAGQADTEAEPADGSDTAVELQTE